MKESVKTSDLNGCQVRLFLRFFSLIEHFGYCQRHHWLYCRRHAFYFSIHLGLSLEYELAELVGSKLPAVVDIVDMLHGEGVTSR